jgi:hypothetical protein
MKNGVEHSFIGLTEKVHRPPKHPKMVRLQVVHQVLLCIPFFKKKDFHSYDDEDHERVTANSLPIAEGK